MRLRGRRVYYWEDEARCCVQSRVGPNSAAMAAIAVERRSATLVSADAAGYSRLMAADELATIQTIKVFREAVQQIALEHGGRLVDSPGDNLLLEFGVIWYSRARVK